MNQSASTCKKLKNKFFLQEIRHCWLPLIITSQTKLLPVHSVKILIRTSEMKNGTFPKEHSLRGPAGSRSALRPHPPAVPTATGLSPLFWALLLNGKKAPDPFEMNYTPVIAAAVGQYEVKLPILCCVSNTRGDERARFQQRRVPKAPGEAQGS